MVSSDRGWVVLSISTAAANMAGTLTHPDKRVALVCLELDTEMKLFGVQFHFEAGQVSYRIPKLPYKATAR